ncbi:MAG: hypothetical protein QM498_00670 [Desulfobacterium sp.]
MKITDPKVIQSGEKAFFNAVKDHLDWNAIREVVTKKMKQCSIESRGGDLIFQENSVAFRIDLRCAMDVSIIVDRNGNLVTHEAPLADFALDEIPSIAAPETVKSSISPNSSGDGKNKQKVKAPAQRPPLIENIDEKNTDDNAGVLELNDLLDELQPGQNASPSPIKEGENSSDDEDMDLETLFFKDKADDDDFDTLADEGTAFWEDKK